MAASEGEATVAPTHTCRLCGQDTTAIEAAKALAFKTAVETNREAYPLVWFIQFKSFDSRSMSAGYFTSKEKAMAATGGRTTKYRWNKHWVYNFYAVTSDELTDAQMEVLDPIVEKW